ncbi:MAG: Efflux transporter periplasmic adaptor subunit [Bacteroidota bacterium]|nr:Efflux transporter periplasmic adaptor subunit [Bacteroidota bacterium]
MIAKCIFDCNYMLIYMKKKKVSYIVGSIIVIILIITVIFRIKYTNAENLSKPKLITNVILGKAIRGEIMQTESMTGDILPIQQANIYSKVNGNIERIFVNIGDYVHAGQVLALIDTTIYSQNVKSASASYSQALANLANIKLNYERNKSLYEQNLISKQDADNSKTAFDVAIAQKDAANANFINTQTLLNYCRITAPFSGYITKRFYDAGTYINSSSGSAGSILFILMDLSKLKAIVNLPEKDIPLLPQIKEIIVTPDALPGSPFDAKINKIGEAVDLSTRTMQVEIYIENTNKQLKPGMFANIKFVLDRKIGVLIIPNEAVLSDTKGNHVFTVSADTFAHKKYIKTGIFSDNKYEVISGIDENDNIVFTGQTLVKEGSKVKIIK